MNKRGRRLPNQTDEVSALLGLSDLILLIKYYLPFSVQHDNFNPGAITSDIPGTRQPVMLEDFSTETLNVRLFG